MATIDEIRARKRENVRRWRENNPDRWQLLQLRSCARRLERHGFTISGGDFDMQTLEPIEQGQGAKGGAGHD